MTHKEDAMRCTGYCRRCRTSHALPQGKARKRAKEIFSELEHENSITLFSNSRRHNPVLTTVSLFGEARGKMFGVLECLAPDGTLSWLYAFSGQYNGEWLVEGWVPPLFDVEAFKQIHEPVARQIKTLGKEIDGLPPGTEQRLTLQKQRRHLSRRNMQDLHALYQITNFRGETATLDSAFGEIGGKPTGTGDCCAPKLLNYAAVSGLTPLSLAEFYFGRDNRSQNRRHGRFYPPCIEKCRPLLGFILCGLPEKRL